MQTATSIPDYLTHYYDVHPFRSITALDGEERQRVLESVAARRELPRRLRSEDYFENRLRYELVMREQFQGKGGRPQLERPHYAVLGESEIWSGIVSHAIQIPLSAIPSEEVSFTYTDSWGAYVDHDLRSNSIPRKPQYGKVYRLEELSELFRVHGWPGDRWKTETDWEHDIYVEAQIWSIDFLKPYLPA